MLQKFRMPRVTQIGFDAAATDTEDSNINLKKIVFKRFENEISMQH